MIVFEPSSFDIFLYPIGALCGYSPNSAFWRNPAIVLAPITFLSYSAKLIPIFRIKSPSIVFTFASVADKSFIPCFSNNGRKTP
ncbi:MAG: hypothetical protein V8R70_06100 [Candidatus Gastranaerophilaceae bacterium]